MTRFFHVIVSVLFHESLINDQMFNEDFAELQSLQALYIFKGRRVDGAGVSGFICKYVMIFIPLSAAHGPSHPHMKLFIFKTLTATVV